METNFFDVLFPDEPTIIVKTYQEKTGRYYSTIWQGWYIQYGPTAEKSIENVIKSFQKDFQVVLTKRI